MHDALQNYVSQSLLLATVTLKQASGHHGAQKVARSLVAIQLPSDSTLTEWMGKFHPLSALNKAARTPGIKGFCIILALLFLSWLAFVVWELKTKKSYSPWE